MSDLTQARLKSVLDYDPETGVFTWLYRPQVCSRMRGKQAGSIIQGHACEYVVITVCLRKYRAHRLAFLWMTGEWPPELVDHIDKDGTNNQWSNLRLATHSQNAANMSTRNRTGFKGIMKTPRDRFAARLWVKGEFISCGTYDTPEEANAAYMEKARVHYGEFARSA